MSGVRGVENRVLRQRSVHLHHGKGAGDHAHQGEDHQERDWQVSQERGRRKHILSRSEAEVRAGVRERCLWVMLVAQPSLSGVLSSVESTALKQNQYFISP